MSNSIIFTLIMASAAMQGSDHRKRSRLQNSAKKSEENKKTKFINCSSKINNSNFGHEFLFGSTAPITNKDSSDAMPFVDNFYNDPLYSAY